MRMRAAVLEEFGKPLAVREVELNEPHAGEVLVRLVACGVCHTDLYTASGADPSVWRARSTKALPASRSAPWWRCTRRVVAKRSTSCSHCRATLIGHTT